MSGVEGKRGWAWIFIVEGLATVVIGVAAYWFISDWPSKAKFLTKDETAYVHARLKADSDATNDEAFTWRNVASCLKDPKCWLYGLVFSHPESAVVHLISIPAFHHSRTWLQGKSARNPSKKVTELICPQAADAQLLTIPPYVLATILCVVYAVVSEHFKKRAIFIAFSSFIGIIGYIILLTNEHPTKRPGVSYVGVFFCAAGIYPAVALGLSWPAMNVSGQTKRASANGLQITIGNLGAVIGTQLYRSNSGPRYIVGHSVALAYLAANIVVVTILAFILRRENKRRDALPPSESDLGEWHGDDDPRWRFTY